MKKFSLFILLAYSFAGFSQDDITICHTPATEKFALFASNKSFNAEHQIPRKYVHETLAGGKMIQLDCNDGVTANAFLIKAKKKSNNWIFVFQEWWGLNDNIKRQSEELYEALGHSVNIIALDMYDGKVATTRENAGKYMQEFKAVRGESIVKGALSLAGTDARIGTIGWCFGGGLSLQAALIAGPQTVGCVMYYGMPEENVEKLKALNSDVLNIWPTQDQWINKAVMDKFENNMKTAGKALTVKAYDAGHGFANPSNPTAYDEEAYNDATKHMLAYFKSKF